MTRNALSLLLCGLALPAAPLAAQASGDGSRAVVQPLPSPAVGDLNSALRRISRNARDVDALLDAGFASLRLDDVEAAIGFFTRAQEVQPANAQVKLGLASAYMRSERPVEAIELYRAAEQAGASTAAMAADRGLAYDLVGDNAAAQQEYARALSGPNGDEVRRRLALSQAIQGNREAFERTLYPLLEKQDFAAYRTRAFALAILGQEKEAIAITEAVMPAELAARIAPYLNYMRRLTPAQQAAAANLGNFPRAAQIGRDDPRIAAYRAGSGAGRTADAALAPSGPPLGTQVAAAAPDRSDSSPQRRRPGRGSSRVDEPVADATPAASQSSAPLTQQVAAAPTGTTTPGAPPASSAPLEQALVIAQQTQAEPPPALKQQPEPGPAATPATTLAAAPTGGLPGAGAVVTAQPGFDLAQVTATPSATTAAPPVVSETPSATPPASPAVLLPSAQTEPTAAPVRVADAFADLAAGPAPGAERAADAVDITRIKPPREVEKKAEPPAPKAPAAKTPPPPPPHPSRHWVQLATGKDKAALRFDWRRMSGKAPQLLGKIEPHVAVWGQTNRLLAGPYDSPKAANAALAALKKAGLDGFTFTSEAGQAVDRLK